MAPPRRDGARLARPRARRDRRARSSARCSPRSSPPSPRARSSRPSSAVTARARAAGRGSSSRSARRSPPRRRPGRARRPRPAPWPSPCCSSSGPRRRTRPGRRSWRACRSASPSRSSPRRWPSRSCSSAPSSSGGGARACSSSLGPPRALWWHSRSRRRLRPPWARRHRARLALLVSPAKGALVFAPVALVGLVGLLRALRAPARRLWDQPGPSRLLPVACGLAVVAHFASLAVAGGWATGDFWGPRWLAPAWPLLLLFLPEGFALLRTGASLLALVSVAVQALGAFTYDGRWDRLHRGPAGELGAVAWDLESSPIALQARERVARLARPGLEGRRLVQRERVVAPSGASGSFVSFAKLPVRPTGVEATMSGGATRGRRARRGGPARARRPRATASRSACPRAPDRGGWSCGSPGGARASLGLGESGLARGAAVARPRRLGVLPPAPPVPLPGVGRRRPARRPALGRPGRARVGGSRPPDRARERPPAVALSRRGAPVTLSAAAPPRRPTSAWCAGPRSSRGPAP